MTKAITVIVVDDHTICREGVVKKLANDSRFGVVGQAPCGYRAIWLTKELQSDVVVINPRLPDIGGVELIREIRKNSTRMNILVLSDYQDAALIAGMIRAGASGYVCKINANEEIAAAIQSVERGELYLSPTFADEVQQRLSTTDAYLTGREIEVIRMLADGARAADIAERLKMSLKTVETHRKHIRDKLGMDSVAELTKYAIRHGLTSL